MLECLIIGDSIAHGVAMHAPQCVAYVKDGISSRGWNKAFAHRIEPARHVIVSLGTNDWETQETFNQLIWLRQRVPATSVTWILPSSQVKPWGHYFVSYVAFLYADNVVTIPDNLLSHDAIHPTGSGYAALARIWRRPV